MPEIQKASEVPELISLKNFLENIPPGKEVSINGFELEARVNSNYYFKYPVIELYCELKDCSGVRFFDPADTLGLQLEKNYLDFVTYTCRNCKISHKVYALRLKVSRDKKYATIFKLGERPSFGPPTPRKVLDITGAEKEYFLKGRQSENQGLGIAAFAYYRRVVENQKDKILDEIIRVANVLVVSPEMLTDLINAKNERQFSKAIESIKHGIPQALMIQGHNPLTLLHDALSEGMHAQSDEECLALATSIRTILSELVEKISFALKEEAELNAAVGTLLKAKAARARKDKK